MFNKNNHSKLNDLHTVIMIAGKAGSGKDTLADYLVKCYGYVKICLADELKKRLAKRYNVDLNTFYDRKKKSGMLYSCNRKEAISVRKAMIEEGQRCKELDVNYWSDIVLNKIAFLAKDNFRLKVVIPDFRFPSEFYRINGFCKGNILSINIVRDMNEYINDISETSLSNFCFDYTFVNNCLKENLYKQFEDADIEL